MASVEVMEEDIVIRYRDCKVVRNGELVEDDVFVRRGEILDPKKLFFDERKQADVVYDCKGLIVAPGFIDIQVNGGFSHDFTAKEGNVFTKIDEVSKELLQYGVTSFCPTVVTSSSSAYKEILPQFCRKSEVSGANVLGIVYA
jgi:N-acetylglucosamine-6-phosphate deacetylase